MYEQKVILIPHLNCIEPVASGKNLVVFVGLTLLTRIFEAPACALLTDLCGKPIIHIKFLSLFFSSCHSYNFFIFFPLLFFQWDLTIKILFFSILDFLGRSVLFYYNLLMMMINNNESIHLESLWVLYYGRVELVRVCVYILYYIYKFNKFWRAVARAEIALSQYSADGLRAL